MDLSIIIAILATVAFGVTLIRHIMFRRELLKLKADMKQYTLTHGVDENLWIMFVERSRNMLSFWR